MTMAGQGSVGWAKCSQKGTLILTLVLMDTISSAISSLPRLCLKPPAARFERAHPRISLYAIYVGSPSVLLNRRIQFVSPSSVLSDLLAIGRMLFFSFFSIFFPSTTIA